MGYANRSGYARTDARNPRAFAVCDSCGTWYNRFRLIDQYEWAGDALIDQRLRDCPRCISKPQPQLRTVILPPDPRPIDDPRPEVPDILQNLNGFIQIVGPQPGMIPGDFSADFGPEFSHGYPLGPYGTAAELDPTRPFLTEDDFVTSIGSGWGTPTPPLTDRSGQTVTSGVPVLIAPANLARQYLVVYNLGAAPLGIAQGTPIFGSLATVMIGAGEAVIQNTGFTPPTPIWRASVYGMSLYPGVQFFAFEG